MANVFAPFGFTPSRRLGGAPTYQLSKRRISAANSTQIFKGDPITQLSTGYINAVAPSSTQIGGIFWGCEYPSLSQKKMVESQYWPGTTTDVAGAVDVTAYVIDDPLEVFRVQGGGAGTFGGGAAGQIVFSAVGMNAAYALGTGNTSSGLSGAYLDVGTIAVTNTLAFRIVGLIYDPPGVNGTDPTTAYNVVEVTFNNQDFKSLTGI